jgi:hypothetical protein
MLLVVLHPVPLLAPLAAAPLALVAVSLARCDYEDSSALLLLATITTLAAPLTAVIRAASLTATLAVCLALPLDSHNNSFVVTKQRCCT